MPSDSSVGFTELVQSRTGPFLCLKNDKYIGQSFIQYGEFSRQEGDFLASLLEPGDFVLEVGANMGAHTVKMAQAVEWGRVFAFEPQRIIFQILCANVALNNLKNVECHWAALGASNCQIEVQDLDPDKENNFGALPLNIGLPGKRVPCYAADDIFNFPRLDLLKIDVEGMEKDVIRGAVNLINQHQPMLYVENDRVENSEALMRMIDGLGYAMYWHTPPLFDSDNFYGKSEDIFPGVASFNMVCAPEHMQKHFDMPKITDFTLHPIKSWQQAAA
jgi:FkbM family methyltransferase